MERQQEQRGICGCGCGQPIDEAWDSEGPAYDADNVICRAGTRLRNYRRTIEEQGADDGHRVFYVAPKRD